MLSCQIDHLILGINNLEKGCTDFENLSGVRPAFSGEHPNWGTHNALLSLDQSYLEVIAPQPTMDLAESPFSIIKDQIQLSLIGWAIQTTNLNEVVQLMDEFGLKHTERLTGSRKTPTGEMLRWESVFLLNESTPSIHPFFIQWENPNLHPSKTTPKGCTLSDITIGNHSDSLLSKFLNKLSIPLKFQKGSKDKCGHLLELELNTPLGKLYLYDSIS